MASCSSQNLETWRRTINSTLDEHKESKICIVSVVGKAPLGNVFAKTDPINDMFERQVFPNAWSLKKEKENEIHAYFDSDSKTFFLHLLSHHDLNLGVNDFLARLSDKDDSKTSFFKALAELEESYYQSMLFLFHLSHIVLFVEPCGRFDMTIARLLRSLNTLREHCRDEVTEELNGIPSVSASWARYGRFCSPRILFAFHKSPIRYDLGNIKKKELLEKLQGCIEDQIYYLFRRSRVITDDSSRSICTVPLKDHFVHVFGPGESVKDPLGNLLAILHDLPPPAEEKKGKDRFWEFLMGHVYEAHDHGFNDNEGKHPIDSYFERPTLDSWTQAAEKLGSFFLESPSEGLLEKMKGIISPELSFSENRCRKAFPLAMDVYQSGLPEFYPYVTHEAKKKQAIEYMKTIARGPDLEASVEKLGEECDCFWRNGRKSCEHLSLTGNNCVNPVRFQRCDAKQQFFFQIHKVSVEKGESEERKEGELPILPHQSKARYLSTCNCGQKQMLRDDPFRLIEANYEFFNRPEFTCCSSLERYPFPLFQTGKGEEAEEEESGLKVAEASTGPTEILIRGLREALAAAGTTQSQEEPLRSLGSTTADLFHVERDNKVKESSLEVGLEERNELKTQEEAESQTSAESESISAEEMDEDEEEAELENEGAGEVEQEYVNPQLSSQQLGLETEVNRKDTTLEWTTELDEVDESMLNFMPNSQAPFGALPVFPSWSVLCLGSSSIYTHAIGLRDKPNFSHGSQFLLPWDVNLKVDLERWHGRMDELNAERSAISGRPKPPPKPKTSGEGKVHVKIFVGFEFECPRGHRFMLQTPDKMLKFAGPGGPKEINAEPLLKSDVPLWFPCTCRSTPPMTGQLMRIHVVTPKAPVLVSLTPRVLPDPRSPLYFHPGAQGRIQLISAKYYILRLPYAYLGPKGPIYPPKEPTKTGRVLKNALSVAPEWEL